MSAVADDAPIAAKLVELDVADIRPNERNPRLIFPQNELDRLAESIDQEGILVPIVVFEDEDHYTLVDGERRFKCAVTLGLKKVPALVTPKRPDHDVLVQMFNIHQIREPWRDVPTAKALGLLIASLKEATGEEVSDTTLRDLTGLSVERVKQLRHVLDLPEEWQNYINDGTIPMNFFWELKRNVIDALAKNRPTVFEQLGGERGISEAFVQKRLDGVIRDTVGLRKVRPIINFAAHDARNSDNDTSVLDQNLLDLVQEADTTIDDVYEDTVQVMVESDKLERRTRSMLANFERLLNKARTGDEIDAIKTIGNDFVNRLTELLQ